MNELCFVKNYSITFYNNFWNTKDCQRSYDFPSFEFLENVSIFDIDWKYILGHGYLQKYNAVSHLLLCVTHYLVLCFSISITIYTFLNKRNSNIFLNHKWHIVWHNYRCKQKFSHSNFPLVMQISINREKCN